VKKNELSDNKLRGTKGFYTALGISAVMIGSACMFAYNQGKKLPDTSETEIPIVREAVVDRKITDIPKQTTAVPERILQAVTEAESEETEEETEEATEESKMDSDFIADYTEYVAEGIPEDAYIAGGEEAVDAMSVEESSSGLPLADISNVINSFSGSELVKSETTGSWQTHNGTDFGAEVGAEVYAVADGEIAEVKRDALWGVTVVIDHNNGFVTRYCNLGDNLAVQSGNRVSRGDLIGFVGQSADIESLVAPHLHIEITHNGSYIDPLSMFSQ